MTHNSLIINQLHKPLLLQSFHENTEKIGVPHYDIHNSLILSRLSTIVHYLNKSYPKDLTLFTFYFKMIVLPKPLGGGPERVRAQPRICYLQTPSVASRFMMRAGSSPAMTTGWIDHEPRRADQGKRATLVGGPQKRIIGWSVLHSRVPFPSE